MRSSDAAITSCASTSLELDRHRAGLDPGQVEHVVDDRQDVCGREPMPSSASSALLGRQVERLQVLGEAGDRLQRRAQLVAERRDELRLGEVGALGRSGGRGRRRGGPRVRLRRRSCSTASEARWVNRRTSSASRSSGSYGCGGRRRTCRRPATGDRIGLDQHAREAVARRPARGTAPSADRWSRRRR